MLDNEKIIACDWKENEGVLEYDISYLHQDLGLLLHQYSAGSYGGERVYQISFSLFGSGNEEEGDFSYLAKEVKERLWVVIFAVEYKFFTECQPDIVEYFIDGRYSMEKRSVRYLSNLQPPGYTIEIDKTGRTITYYKQEGGPAGDGGPPLL